jgi:hypothetical protein
VIKRLGFRIRATGLLTIPQAGGGLEPSKDYDVLLPGTPRVGQLVVYKISQEVQPRANDRFTVRLDEPEPERQLGPRLYQLDVLLYHDTTAAPVKAGTALVAVPYRPDKSFFWAGVAPSDRGDYGNIPPPSMKENEKTFRRMMALPGEQPPELTLDLVDVPVKGPFQSSPCAAQTAQQPLSGG